jgi:chromosome segregation ATPase
MSDLNTQSGNNADLSEFKKLQKRLNHDGIRQQFRTKVVGGLNEEDVTNYILTLEEKLKKLELDNKKATDEIFSLRSKINIELDSKDNLITNIDELKQDLNSYMNECSQKEAVIVSVREKYNLENSLMKNEIHQMTESKNKLEKVLNESLLEIDEKKARLSDIELTFEELNQKNSLLTEERNELLKQISISRDEIDYINENAIKFKNENQELIKRVTLLETDNDSLIAKISEMSEDSKLVSVLNEEKIKMEQEIKAYEELLNQSIVKFDQLKEKADSYEYENINLNKKIAEIEEAISAKDNKISEVNRVSLDLRYQLDIEKSRNKKIDMDLAIFKQKISSLQDTVNSTLAELDEQKKKAQNAEIELNLEKSKVVSYQINGFKDEFADMYEKIANLEFEAKQYLKSSTILQQQLTIQKNRADKAEYDLGTFMDMLSEIKEKFYNEQINLDEEFAQLFAKKISTPDKDKLIMNFD